MKKFIWTFVFLFILSQVVDMVMHGVILTNAYQQTMHLWRPFPEMKRPLLYLTTIINCVVFIWIYSLINNKSMMAGLKYGLLFGIASGFGMGFASYATMPITMYIATVWFLGTVIKMVLSGIIVGIIVK